MFLLYKQYGWIWSLYHGSQSFYRPKDKKSGGVRRLNARYLSSKRRISNRHTNLIPNRDHVLELMKNFKEITFYHIPIEENQVADALAKLSSKYKVNYPN